METPEPKIMKSYQLLMEVVDVVRRYQMSKGVSAVEISRHLNSRSRRRLSNYKEVKVLLREAVKRGALVRFGDKYKTTEEENSEKLESRLSKLTEESRNFKVKEISEEGNEYLEIEHPLLKRILEEMGLENKWESPGSSSNSRHDDV